jgi:hypothetical protein
MLVYPVIGVIIWEVFGMHPHVPQRAEKKEFVPIAKSP